MLSISVAATPPHLLSRRTPPAVATTTDPRSVSRSMAATGRPKLSLKTLGLTPTFGGPTNLRAAPDATAAATPTTLNTFTNTYDLTLRPSPGSATASPIVSSPCRLGGPSPLPNATPSQEVYALNLPFGVHSILKNSPLRRDGGRPSGCSAYTSPRGPGKRVFFPSAKKVSFRATLNEEIPDVAPHADLGSSEDSDGPSDALGSSEEGDSHSDTDDPAEADAPAGAKIRVDEYSVRQRKKRKSSSLSEKLLGDLKEDPVEKAPSSPVPRTKRTNRRWEWSLAPVTEGESTRAETDVKDRRCDEPLIIVIPASPRNVTATDDGVGI